MTVSSSDLVLEATTVPLSIVQIGITRPYIVELATPGWLCRFSRWVIVRRFWEKIYVYAPADEWHVAGTSPIRRKRVS